MGSDKSSDTARRSQSEAQLKRVVGRVQRRLSGLGKPLDEECVRAVLAALTHDEAMDLMQRHEGLAMTDV